MNPYQTPWRVAMISLLLFLPTTAAAEDVHEYLRGSNPVYDASAWNPGLGVPGGRLEDAGGALSGNYRTAIPVIQLPGRGLALNLQLHYNSQLWSRSSDSGYELSFNANGDWPAAGWSFGFGKIAFPEILYDSDNTQHNIRWTESKYSGGVHTMKGHFSAGSSTTITCTNCGKAGIEGQAVVAYPDGRSVTYTALGGVAYKPVMYPTMLLDANGNYIGIQYRRDADGKARPPMIDKIIDTVGRVVDFHYDNADKLTAISGPDLQGARRTYVRFFYSARNMDTRIKLNNGDVVPARNHYTAIDAIYFPGNRTAFVPTDYLRHGAAGELQQRRGVQVDTPVLTEQGRIVDLGSLTRAVKFDFAWEQEMTAPPQYTKKTERWSDPVSGQERSASTSYALLPDEGWRIFKVTYPDGTSSLQGATNEPGRFDRGLVSIIQIRSAQDKVLRTTMIEWEQGALGAPRQKAVTFSNVEIGRQTRTEFRYGQNEQQIVEELHYGFGDSETTGPLLWRRQVDYLAAPAYGARNLHNLPTSVRYFVGASEVPQTRVDYAYDEVPVASVSPVVGHLNQFDPVRAGKSRMCARYDYEPGPDGRPVRYCAEFREYPRYRPDFHGVRGNVTSIKRYADAAAGSGAITTNFRFDSVGNRLSTSDQVGRAVSHTYDASTQFSLPSSIVSGDADPASPERIGWTHQYDLSTGLLRSLTNPDGRTATYDYVTGASGWRLSKRTDPNGAVHARTYLDDTLRMATSVSGTADGPAVVQLEAFDGKGLLRESTQVQPEGPGRVSGREYDLMGRLTRQSRPYLAGATPAWATHAYDEAGRLAAVTGPDGSAVRYFHNEPAMPDSVLSGERAETLRIEDAWGRSRWINYDEQRNIRAVVEPAPGGSGNVFEPGSLVTRYYFNTLGWLKAVTQGSQLSYFEYDSLGRMVKQSLPARQRSLDAAGNYVAEGSFSDVFAYDDAGKLVSATDARGVTTHFDYHNDPLGRLRKVRYAIGPAPGSLTQVEPVADIVYAYVDSGDLRRIERVTSTGVASEAYGYDPDGQLLAATLTLQAHPDSPFVTGYDFEPLGKLRSLQYPARYTGTGVPHRATIRFNHDAQGSLVNAEIDGAAVADSFGYHPDGSLSGLRLHSTNGPIFETYQVDQLSGMLTGQDVTRNGQALVQLRYEPHRTEGLPPAPIVGVTGQITAIHDLLDANRSQSFRYDALGRLSRATLGNLFSPAREHTYSWQEYSYDRYGNRTSVKAFAPAPPIPWEPVPPMPLGPEWPTTVGPNAGNRTSVEALAPASPVPLGRDLPTRIELDASRRDGIGELAVDERSNHISAPGFAYDEAGNLTGMDRGDGLWQKQVYDAAGRLARVTDDDGYLVETYLYGADNRPIGVSGDMTRWTYWTWSGNTRLSRYEYAAGSAQQGPYWSNNAFFIGSRPLLTEAPSATGTARTFLHPGRLGILAASSEGTVQTVQQGTLPYGTERGVPPPWADARRFTSYERAPVSGLDQAVSRNYADRLGRFLQVDPLGVTAVSPTNPQTLNAYTYGRNDPVNRIDPSGLVDSVSPMSCSLPDGATMGNGFACIGGVVTFYGPEVLVVGTLPSVTGGSGLEPGATGGGGGGGSDGGGSGGSEGGSGSDNPQDGCRMPDFFAVNLNIVVPSPLGTLFGWSGTAGLDRYGTLYWSPLGAGVGKSALAISASASANWLNQPARPSEGQLNNFLTAHGFNAGAASGPAISGSYSPGNGTALGFGIGTPQFGVSYNYSFEACNLGTTW